ncbi:MULTISPECIES: hypothetical protein [Bacteria]|uniref:hypothetical protein n=1 Tax=Bacteria TaxID=2 RepID=UPI003C7B8D7F
MASAHATVPVTLKFQADKSAFLTSLADELHKLADELAHTPNPPTDPERYVLVRLNDGDYGVLDRDQDKIAPFFTREGAVAGLVSTRTGGPRHYFWGPASRFAPYEEVSE